MWQKPDRGARRDTGVEEQTEGVKPPNRAAERGHRHQGEPTDQRGVQ